MMQNRSHWSTRPLFILTLCLCSVSGCTRQPTSSGEGGWLAGTVDQKFETVAKTRGIGRDIPDDCRASRRGPD